MKVALAILLLLFAAGALAAEESVVICFNYGCASEATALFSDARLADLHDLLAGADDAEHERAMLATAVGRLYAWAGEQTPIWRDKAGNLADEGAYGRMDCIDHSITTTRFLRLLAARHLLRFHRVLEPVLRRRFVISEHRSALVGDIVSGQRFVVDSWYVDNGRPAVVMPLERWMFGDAPNE